MTIDELPNHADALKNAGLSERNRIALSVSTRHISSEEEDILYHFPVLFEPAVAAEIDGGLLLAFDIPAIGDDTIHGKISPDDFLEEFQVKEFGESFRSLLAQFAAKGYDRLHFHPLGHVYENLDIWGTTDPTKKRVYLGQLKILKRKADE